MWVATGLLAPIVLGLPAGLLVQSLSGGSPIPQGQELSWWVFALVYGGFALLGASLAALFVRYARERWPDALATAPAAPPWPVRRGLLGRDRVLRPRHGPLVDRRSPLGRSRWVRHTGPTDSAGGHRAPHGQQCPRHNPPSLRADSPRKHGPHAVGRDQRQRPVRAHPRPAQQPGTPRNASAHHRHPRRSSRTDHHPQHPSRPAEEHCPTSKHQRPSRRLPGTRQICRERPVNRVALRWSSDVRAVQVCCPELPAGRMLTSSTAANTGSAARSVSRSDCGLRSEIG